LGICRPFFQKRENALGKKNGEPVGLEAQTAVEKVREPQEERKKWSIIYKADQGRGRHRKKKDTGLKEVRRELTRAPSEGKNQSPFVKRKRERKLLDEGGEPFAIESA